MRDLSGEPGMNRGAEHAPVDAGHRRRGEFPLGTGQASGSVEDVQVGAGARLERRGIF